MTRNPILSLILLGALCLAIALTDLLIQESKTGVQVVNSWSILHIWGKVAVIGFVAILGYLIYRFALKVF